MAVIAGERGQANTTPVSSGNTLFPDVAHDPSRRAARWLAVLLPVVVFSPEARVAQALFQAVFAGANHVGADRDCPGLGPDLPGPCEPTGRTYIVEVLQAPDPAQFGQM